MIRIVIANADGEILETSRTDGGRKWALRMVRSILRNCPDGTLAKLYGSGEVVGLQRVGGDVVEVHPDNLPQLRGMV
jgi:hypothetical protein